MNGNDVSYTNESGAAYIQMSLFMFISVQSWTFDGSWCCLWTEADRKTRLRRGLLKISSTWFLFHRCGTRAGSSGWGRTAVAAWVASVREGLERRTRDCLNMEGKRGQRRRKTGPSNLLIDKGPINYQIQLGYEYFAEKYVSTRKPRPVA